MSDTDLLVPDDAADALLAIELALGLLEPDARVAAERRVEDDPAFAALHRRWQVRALALLEGREERPPERVWTAILRRIPANDGGRSVRRWQAATAVAAALALAFGATLALREQAPPVVIERRVPAPAPALVAVLASPERDAVVAVRYDATTRRVSALPERLTTGGREAELWVIPAGGAPVAAGLLAPRGRTTLSPDARVAALMVPGATLAISLEPPGGSRTGAPTGPVILTGTIARS